MLTDEQIEQYQRSGFVNGGPLIDDATVESLRAEIHRVIDDRDNPAVPQPLGLSNLGPDAEHPVWQIANIYEASPAFRALVTNPQLAAMAAQLTAAKELRIWHDQVQAQRQLVLSRAYLNHPARFVNGPPVPPALPTAAWINPPPSPPPATTIKEGFHTPIVV